MPLLGVAFVAAVVATGIFYGLLIPRLRNSASADSPRTVVVAGKALDRGTVLKAEDMRVVGWDGAPPANAISAADQVIGATVMEPIAANQPVTTNLVARRGAGGASLAIPPGRRAVSIHPLESSGVVTMLRSGSRLDIQVIDTRGQAQLKRIMDDVEVLSVQGAESPRPVVTLLVTPEEADRLSLADASMQLRVIVRNPNDRSPGGPAPTERP